MKLIFKWSLGVILFGLLWGCDKPESVEQEQKELSVADYNGELVATINQQEIYSSELDALIERTFGSHIDRAELEASVESNLLDGLIKTKTFALLRLTEMSAEEKHRIDTHTQIYREELLAQEYIRKHGKSLAVKSEEIREYYKEHPELFVADEQKRIEWLDVSLPLADEDRDQWLTLLQNIKDSENWQEALNAQGSGLGIDAQQASIKKFAINPVALKQPLKSVVRDLQPEQGAKLVTQDALGLVRVTEVISAKPRPLAEVAGAIETKLKHQKMLSEVQKLSEIALAEVTITKLDSEKAPQ